MGDQLSYDLVVNILCRLPVKSLLGLRCVCKSWNSIISQDDYFSNLHLLHHINNNNNPTLVSCPQTTAIIYDDDDDNDNCEGDYIHLTKVKATAISTYDALSLSLVSHRLLQFPSIHHQNKPFFAKSEIISSCHGVLCLGVRTKEDGYSLYLYNPSIRKFNYVISYPKTKYYLVGFGFAPLHNDYKIVMVCMDTPEPVKVYSLRNTTTSWSILPTAPVGLDPYHPARSSTYLNGKCHWEVSIPHPVDDNHDIKLPPNNSIWYFDLNSNTFGYIMQPHDCHINLMVYKDMLSLYFVRRWSELHVWVMKEYGVAESWSSLVTLDLDQIPRDCFFGIPSVLRMDVHSKILLRGGAGLLDNPIVLLPMDAKLNDGIELCWPNGRSYYDPLIVYDPENKKPDFRQLLIHGPSQYFHYQESLILFNQNPHKTKTHTKPKPTQNQNPFQKTNI